MYRVVSCCMVLYCIALYIASWYNTVSVVLCRVHDWPSTGLCCIVFHCTVSCCIVFRCTVLCWIMFHCTVLLCRVHDWPRENLSTWMTVSTGCDGVLYWFMLNCIVLYCAVSMTDPWWTCRRRGWWCPQGVTACCPGCCALSAATLTRPRCGTQSPHWTRAANPGTDAPYTCDVTPVLSVTTVRVLMLLTPVM